MMDWLAFSVTLQPPLPVHAPSHCRKFQPPAGLSVRATFVPTAKLAVQMVGQLMPAGELVTVPPGLPMTETDSEGESVKVADTFCAEFMASVQVLALPLHAPPQALKIQPLVGVSVKVTSVPRSKAALQVVGQLTPLGELVTVPPSAAAPVGKPAASGNMPTRNSVRSLRPILIECPPIAVLLGGQLSRSPHQ